MTSLWCCFGAGIRSFARLPCVTIWSLLISVVSCLPDILSILSRTENLSSALLSCDSDGFLIIGIPSDSEHSLQILIIPALEIPSKSLVSSELFLHMAHLIG